MIFLCDLFDSAINIGDARLRDYKYYLEIISKETWEPLVLPDEWLDFGPFPHVQSVMDRMKERHKFITLANPQIGFQLELLRRARLRFDWIVPLELVGQYKPSQVCFTWAKNMLRVEPNELCVVSAKNKDIDTAHDLGMDAMLIERGDYYKLEKEYDT